MASRLERAIARLARRPGVIPDRPADHPSGVAFRAAVEERLRSLERQLEEVKGRINGLLFMVAGTALAQIIRGLLS